MGTRRFEYSDEKSNKFWEITVNGNEHTVRYGRIGADGQTKTKEFADAEAAEKDAEKLIKSKTKKGYEEVSAGGDGGPGEQVWALLKGLCKTSDDEAILRHICDHVGSFSDDEFVIEHDGYEWEVAYAPGAEVVYNDYTPKSFSAIREVVTSLTWDGGGPEVGFEVGDEGQSYADEWLFDLWADEDEEAAAEIKEAGDVTASFVAGQNGLFFDPTKKLSNGEMGLAFIDHEGGGWESCDSVKEFDYGQILLRLLSDCMVDTRYVPEASF